VRETNLVRNDPHYLDPPEEARAGLDPGGHELSISENA